MSLDHRVLRSSLVSGALWLMVPLLLGAWPLVPVGAAYVVPASLFLAWVHGRDRLTPAQEGTAWVVTALGAVLTWACALGLLAPPTDAGGGLVTLWAGLVVGLPCVVAWQLGAVAVRRWTDWRHPPRPTRRA